MTEILKYGDAEINKTMSQYHFSDKFKTNDFKRENKKIDEKQEV